MKKYKVLNTFRFFLGLTFLLLYTLLFFGILSLSFLAEIQLIPAIVHLKNGFVFSILVIFIILFLTSIFGRFYCSFLCPFGFLQELSLSGRRSFAFKKLNIILPMFIILIFVIFLFHFNFIIGFIDPYSIFGKFITLIVKPTIYFLNNRIHFVIPSIGYLRMYEFSVYLVIFILSMLASYYLLSLFFGRFFCNFICPAGAIYRFFSKNTFFQLNIDSEKCIKCMKCEKVCPALCIDPKKNYLDYSRCFLCLKCFECPNEAISFKFNLKSGNSKAAFLSHGKSFLTFFVFVFFRNKLFGLSANRSLRLLPSPPGSFSFEYLKKNCISCLLCVSHCPTKVLKPAFTEYGIDGIFMPVMNYPKSFCIYECNVCGNVCPTNAITHFTLEDKKTIQIGRAKLINEKCVVYRDKVDCGACSEVCPTKAAFMVDYEKKLLAPQVDTRYCVGCGACENVCPAKPEKAIYVEANPVHQKTILRKEEKTKIEEFTEFPF